MYIKMGENQYPCTDYRASPGGSATFHGVEGVTLPVAGEVVLYADDGFEMAWQDAAAFARQVYENSVLTLTNEPEPEIPVPTIEEVRAAKLAELSAACEAAIVAGVDVETAYGTGHYGLSLGDQINIKALYDEAEKGSPGPYHADGQPCMIYSAADIITLYRAAQGWKIYQLTYFGQLKQWVDRETDAAAVQSITYGAELPTDLAAEMAALMAAASSA